MSRHPPMSLSQIEKLKAEIAELEGAALKELQAKREALLREIASVDAQIAEISGTVAGPSPGRRAEEKPAFLLQQPKLPVAEASKERHSRDQEDQPPRIAELPPEAGPQRLDNDPASVRSIPPISFSDSLPVYPPRIPVLGKSSTPVGFCYPLGASAMSEALMGLPMFDRFTLRYSNRTPIFTMAQPVKGFPILRMNYSNYPVYAARSGTLQGGERWAIEVLLIPFHQRDYLQKVILERAVPLLREWLTGPDSPGNNVRRTAKACWYVINADTVQWVDDVEEDEDRG